ncbi:carbohydrate ABC transporter permease [Burkholderia ubonensis]|uniref:ABC transporter permease n=1 Tax=Burkholderia ubonensis TaxID=101571 RepID=A0A105IKY0_9BURK|nr:sugar ABC transporter permease [Burkholderia ubonensis]AOK61060.1 ABC transporter permease [Burkholderia ubonensis]KVS41421.1 ABC transporter permease [Burkholderia ubonensis]KVS53808.1 ABC transporter permease [Burkholderia ubonensis]KVS69958.1 ABC transporter permease [Burkholderia ubonensis]KVS85000.1 ABC transporter permease [Burkholderia ubonensis]
MNAPPITPRTPGRGIAHASWDDRWLGPLMLAPALVYIALLLGFPFLLAIWYSLTDVTVGSQAARFVGAENFRHVVQSPQFWKSLRNALVFTLISQALVVVLAKILALALARDFPGKWLVRLVILLPWVAPISLGSIGWLWIFDPVYSIINWTLHALGAVGPGVWPIWLGQPDLAMASVIVVDVWRLLPLATVIILAGMQGIPRELHDAAAMDGAGFWRRLFRIDIPLLMPVMLVALLFGIVFTLTDMIIIYVLTRGGPYDTTQVLASLAFFTGIQGGDLAEGAAISLFLFPLLVAVVVLLLTVAHRAEVI